MMRPIIRGSAIAVLCIAVVAPTSSRAAADATANMDVVVAQSIEPLMQRYGIPGMAVGIAAQGRHKVYDYGVASKATGRPVTGQTLFEIGSLSKAFTATLAAYAQVSGRLSLSDVASKYLPSLRGSAFDRVTLLDLGTHTAGGLPLQVPDGIATTDQLMAYLQGFNPVYAPGTYRLYSNLGIGLLGIIAARAMNGDFATLMQTKLFSALGLRNTYLDVPSARADSYAQGYTTTDTPTRMRPGVLATEAYGIRSTAGDMLRFVEANMGETSADMAVPDATLRQAITRTHTGYDRLRTGR